MSSSESCTTGWLFQMMTPDPDPWKRIMYGSKEQHDHNHGRL